MDLSYLDLLMAHEGDEIDEAAGGGGIWVVVENRAKLIAAVTFEVLGAARTLADSIGAYVYAVLLGEDVSSLARSLYQAGADGVSIAEDASLEPFAVEPHLAVLANLFEERKPEVVLMGATDMGNELAPRLAQRLRGGLIERATSLALDETSRTVQAHHAVHWGDYYQVVSCREGVPQVFTVEPGAFPYPLTEPHRYGNPTFLPVSPMDPKVQVVGLADEFVPPPVPLTKAPVIVAVGRQASSLSDAQQLAEALAGVLAGDRGAFDAGWITRDQMVDVRGTEVSPELYVAIGIRGDTFHNAAMKDSRFIVALHPDAEAPIFEIADICAVADPADLMRALLDELGVPA